jgi:hypothetical protein
VNTKLTYVEYEDSINDMQLSPCNTDSFDAIEERFNVSLFDFSGSFFLLILKRWAAKNPDFIDKEFIYSRKKD